ncbi:MAG TPA: hypothetical protein VNI61_11525, partial [Gemmatimonadales bacterium]|nr:hypothetical protein [Gemmatimonadales bacterium]
MPPAPSGSWSVVARRPAPPNARLRAGYRAWGRAAWFSLVLHGVLVSVALWGHRALEAGTG